MTKRIRSRPFLDLIANDLAMGAPRVVAFATEFRRDAVSTASLSVRFSEYDVVGDDEIDPVRILAAHPQRESATNVVGRFCFRADPDGVAREMLHAAELWVGQLVDLH